MLAVIHDRGRQLLVEPGQSLLLDHLPSAQEGQEVVFDEVLSLGGRVGTPFVSGARVTARVDGHELGKKLHIIKFRRRKDYRRRVGHRQQYTRVTIASISG